MRRRGVAMVVVAALAVPAAGCGGDGAADGEASAPATASAVPAPAAGAMPADGGITLGQARQQPEGTTVLVRAFVVDHGGGPPQLCDGLTRRLPPDCGPGAVDITGLPPGFLDDAERAGASRWTPEPVQLVGVLRDGVFVTDPTALAAS